MKLVFLKTTIVSQCNRIGIHKRFMNFFVYKTDLILIYKTYVQNINMPFNDSLSQTPFGENSYKNFYEQFLCAIF